MGPVLREFRSNYLGTERLAGLLLAYPALLPFFSAFASVKVAIPLLPLFASDVAFIRLDQILHFGHHPWELLHGLLPGSLATRILDLLSVTWFPVLIALPSWMAITRHRELRLRFFLAVFASWIRLGSIRVPPSMGSRMRAHFPCVGSGTS